MRPVLNRFAFAIASLACAAPAFSQTTVASADNTPQKVEVNGHYANGVGTSDAASQGTVRGERLSDLPLLRPGEVLETIPGMVVAQHSGDGKANQYFLRGYNLDHGTDFATAIDGVPVNMPTNAHGQGYTDLNFLIPELVNRIEYRKGPYFAEDGDFSSAGSARIKYVDRIDGGLLNLTGGSDGYRRLVLAGSPTLFGLNDKAAPNGPRLLTAIELEHDDGPWTTPERLRKTNALARLSDGDLANGWSVDGNVYAAHWTSTDQVPLALIEDGTLGRFSAMDPTDGGDTGRAIVSGEWHARDDAGYTSVSAYAEHYRLKLWSNFTYFELRPDTGDQFLQEETRNILGVQAAKGWQHTLLGNDSTTEIGAQARHDNIAVGLSNTEKRAVFGVVTDDHVSETSLGAYVQNTTTWTPWLRSLAGLRVDRVVMNMTDRVDPVNTGAGAGAKVSPKLSLVFGPWSKTEFFVNAGRGFHSNDARGVIDKVDATTHEDAHRVPPLVGSRGAEIGLRTDIVPGLQSSMALWKLDSDSELVYETDSAIGSTSANGASKRYGVEWNNHMIVNRWLLLDADIAWTHARYAGRNANGEDGNLIPNALSRVGSLGVTLHELGPWSAGLITRFLSGVPLNQTGSFSAPSSVVTNLLVKRVLTPHCTLALDVLNLFDRKFYDMEYEQDYVTKPGGVLKDDVTAHPGEPREFRVSLDLTF